jgi:DNA-binding beta-propeller fold protein YncE
MVLAGCALVVLGIAGCDCGGSEIGHRCSTNRDCPGGQVCVDRRCMSPDRRDARVDEPDSGGEPGCIDGDRDGYGMGCPGGTDCDDTNPMRGGPEVCDAVDNDCDGRVDEGLADICTSCTPACAVSMFPGPGGWMPGEENSQGVVVDEGGALTLGRTRAEAFAVWVANSDEGTVSKLDSRTNREIARYPTVGALGPSGIRPWYEACGWCEPRRGGCIGNCPSRTAVDQNFDAYVANRAFGNQGTVTKIANREEDCIDRNGNGVIDTSRDLNGDGTIALTPMGIGNEFVGPEDECILWTVPAGGNNGVPRALAVGLSPPDGLVGDVWVGLYNEAQACRLHPMTGATIACMPINGLRPYGAAADSRGRIWFVDRSGSRRDILGYVDPTTMTFQTASPVPGSSCPTSELHSYGITIDGDDRVYVASSNCAPHLLRYLPATDTWEMYTIPGDGTPRGLAADEHSLWVGISHEAVRFAGGPSDRVVQFRLSDMAFVATHRIPMGRAPVGVGVSYDGSVWAICQGTNSAARFDPATGTWLEHGVGLGPYTYSDFIGFGLNVFAEPRGRYRFRVDGCERGTQNWLGVRVRAEVPPMTEVAIWARSANTIEALATQPFIGPFLGPVVDLRMPPGPVPPGRYLEIEIRLRTEDRRVAPRVFSVDVAGECAPRIE